MEVNVTIKPDVTVDRKEAEIKATVFTIALSAGELAGASFVELIIDGRTVGMMRVQD